MNLIRTILTSALVVASCAGCSLLRQDPLIQGEPIIGDKVFLLHDQDPALCDPAKPGVVTCTGSPCENADNLVATASGGPDAIKKCTMAMKLLIDVRWAHFSDELLGAVNNGTAVIDLATVGLNGAATLAPTGTSQILSAIAGGLGSAKTTINQDILYKNSVTLILLQMKKDRASWGTVIMTKLNASGSNGYQSMYEAATDLYAYDRAGSWNEALVSMQSSAGAQTAACEAEQKKANLASADGKTLSTDTSQVTATSPCDGKPSSNATNAPDQVSVSFKNGTSTLTDNAKSTIKNAAQRFMDEKHSAAEVTGMADASGEASANADLARARGQSTFDEFKADLVALGAAAPKITLTDPYVATKTGSAYQSAAIKLLP